MILKTGNAIDTIASVPLPLTQRSIADEVKGWSQGKFFGVRGGRREENSNPSTEFSTPPSANTTVYNAEDLQQNGVLDVECQLGTGGMGHVYMARNKEDGTFVAVKVGKEVGDQQTQLTADQIR